jgi:hypothetical protein
MIILRLLTAIVGTLFRFLEFRHESESRIFLGASVNYLQRFSFLGVASDWALGSAAVALLRRLANLCRICKNSMF